MSEEPPNFLLQGASTYAQKNEDYGDSWRTVGKILHLLADGEPIELESVEDHIAYGLYTRRLDKFARGFHGEFISDEPNFESIEDAHSDEMVYASMQASNYVSGQADRPADGGGTGDDQGDGGILGAAARLSSTAGEVLPGVFRGPPRPESNPRRGNGG